MAELLCWLKMKGDRKDEASKLVGVPVPQEDALKVARAIEQIAGWKGDYPFLAVIEEKEDGSFVAGHGTLIKYDSGRTRHVRRDW